VPTGIAVVVQLAEFDEIAWLEQPVIPEKLTPSFENSKLTVPVAPGVTDADTVTEVPTRTGEAGVAPILVTALGVVPVVIW
jgi:L-alanine-DL-glutamate epimerase-like enolase superfamily enzyme